MPIILPQSGSYTISLTAYGVPQSDGVSPKISAHLNDLAPYSDNSGESQIKSQLKYLHERLLGETLDVDSEEIHYSYQFFVAAWQARWDDGVDFYITDSNSESCEEPEGVAAFSDDEMADPQHTLAAWSQVLLYLMTDYQYLHE